VTEAPSPLLDIEAVRSLTAPTVIVLRRSVPTIVLGSTQRAADLDDDALVRDGVTVRRRRGGGGAVLLRPDDCWIELWLPATSNEERGDVRTTAYRVGRWWEVALSQLGLVAEVHHGAVRHADQGAVACFAGLGPGELTIGHRKLVGLSQWRAREGALISSVLAADEPVDLLRYLAPDDVPVPQLAFATSLAASLPGTGADRVAQAFCDVVRDELLALVREDRLS
jgi:lipoate---protein ligase